MIHKIIEWDKRRKFGTRFSDFLLLLFLDATINAVITCLTHKINITIMIVTTLIYGILTNRNPPEEF